MPDDLERFIHPTRHLAKALQHHASGLRLSLYGMLLTLCGLVALLIWFIGPVLDLPRNALTWAIGPAAILAIIGAFVNMWGKYRCFEFPIELSGRWMLNVAIWCDGIMLTTRFFSRMIPLLKVARLAEPVLLLAGLVFFLLFLRSLADVIQRADLKRSALQVLVSLGVGILAVAMLLVGAAVRTQVPGLAVPMLIALIVSLLSLALTTALYARLLWKMSHGLDDFAKYLLAAEDHLDVEEGDNTDESS